MRFPVYSRLSYAADEASRLSSNFNSLTNSRNPSPGKNSGIPDNLFVAASIILDFRRPVSRGSRRKNSFGSLDSKVIVTEASFH